MIISYVFSFPFLGKCRSYGICRNISVRRESEQIPSGESGISEKCLQVSFYTEGFVFELRHEKPVFGVFDQV